MRIDQEGPCTAVGRIVGLRTLRLKGRRTLVRGSLEDSSGSLPLVWWNRPFLQKQILPGVLYVLHGQVRARGGSEGSSSWELLNPSVVTLEKAEVAIVPVYGGAGPLAPSRQRRFAAAALDRLPADRIADPLPESLRVRRRLPPLGESLHRVHRPRESDDLLALSTGTSSHRRRLVYGELLESMMAARAARRSMAERRKGHHYRPLAERERQLIETLPFQLTVAQQKVLAEIHRDLELGSPMRRLLQGDVGSGKTVVAALALARAVNNGFQGAFMVPTELLAEQVWQVLRGLLGRPYRCLLLTSASAKKGTHAEIAGGAAQIVVGTHALIQEATTFSKLALIVIDEQHRFGAEQRQRLVGKGFLPDLLVMTATPIPRSLALTRYGDLDLSLLDELPPGRAPVETVLIPEDRRAEAYARLKARLAEGGQGFVVCPAIDTTAGQRSLAQVRKELLERFFFGDLSEREGRKGTRDLGVLHGRLTSDERRATMSSFASGRTRLLLTTTVVEVGVDVPAATTVVIEGGEHFGLAQLHQIRGRVGRGRASAGEAAALCCVVHGSLSDLARRRLAIFAATTDGFRIAEEDLALRGAGDLEGSRQTGVPHDRLGRLLQDATFLEAVVEDAKELFQQLDAPSLAFLRRRVDIRAFRRLAATEAG